MGNDEAYKGLFAKLQQNEDGQTKEYAEFVKSMFVNQSGALVTESMFKKLHWMRLICSVAVRLSLIASVWLFLFRTDLWYGMPLFLILTLLFGGIQDRNIPTK